MSGQTGIGTSSCGRQVTDHELLDRPHPQGRIALDLIGRLLPLLDAVNDTVTEVRTRGTEYFDHQPLRLRPSTLRFHDPSEGPMSELIARIGQVYGVDVSLVDDEAALTAVDRLVERRANTEGWTRLEDLDLIGEADTAAVFDAVRRSQEKAALRIEEEARRYSGSPSRRVGVMGGLLPYHVVGRPDPDRPPVVVLNALGMGLRPWHRLVALLSRRHRVIAWAPRGCAPDERPLRLTDHVADLTAVLGAEDVADCHLLTWCTGPKVAMEFHRRAPDVVRSMVFLNGSFRLSDGPQDYDTAYERNLQTLCRAVVGRPGLADTMRRMLGGGLGERPDISAETEPHRLAEQILALPAHEMHEELRRPFATGPELVAYARQILDFWSWDPLPHAPKVDVPVLSVTSEFDQVAAPERLERETRRFPDAQHVRLSGATHYAMYDRPRELTAILVKFYDESDRR